MRCISAAAQSHAYADEAVPRKKFNFQMIQIALSFTYVELDSPGYDSLRYELTLQNAQRALSALLEQPATPWVPFAAPRRTS